MTKQRSDATKMLLEKIASIDKHSSADNVSRYTKLLGDLSDNQFDSYMKKIRDKEACFYVYIPNMDKHPSMNDVVAISKKMGVELFQRLYQHDVVTDTTFLSPEKYLVVRVPIRRMQQYGDHKMAVPRSDTKIDGLTGQVVHESRAAGITNPEIQSLMAKGLDEVSREIVSIRGGNIESYASGIKKQAEETGIVHMDEIEKDSKNRTVVIAQVLLEGLHLANNLSEG